MRIPWIAAGLLILILAACSSDELAGLPPSVATGAAQAPTLAAAAAGTAAAAAQAVATQSAAAFGTAAPQVQTQVAAAQTALATPVAGVFATAMPAVQTAVAAGQTEIATPAGAVSTAALPIQTVIAAARTAVATPLFPLTLPAPSSSVTVDVKLSEYRIDMPATFQAGAVTFRVTNAGTIEHGFQIQGQGIDKKLDTNVKPGTTEDFQVTLIPGAYRAFCPVDGHKDLGMLVHLTAQ
jgi:hypothetical protein